LDAPLVLEGKRVRKSTEFLSNTINTPQSIEKKKIEIPQVLSKPCILLHLSLDKHSQLLLVTILSVILSQQCTFNLHPVKNFAK
jgi:hypothetical protein